MDIPSYLTAIRRKLKNNIFQNTVFGGHDAGNGGKCYLFPRAPGMLADKVWTPERCLQRICSSAELAIKFKSITV